MQPKLCTNKAEPTVENFIDAFQNAVTDSLPDLLSNWTNQRKFTKYVESSLYPAFAKYFDCDLYLERDWFDATLMQRQVDEETGLITESVLIAIEHENNFGNSIEEIVKLVKLNAPLGVLITYASPHQRLPKLQEFTSHLESMISVATERQLGNILVVFGTYGMSRPKDLQWEFFATKDGTFERIGVWLCMRPA